MCWLKIHVRLRVSPAATLHAQNGCPWLWRKRSGDSTYAPKQGACVHLVAFPDTSTLYEKAIAGIVRHFDTTRIVVNRGQADGR